SLFQLACLSCLTRFFAHHAMASQRLLPSTAYAGSRIWLSSLNRLNDISGGKCQRRHHGCPQSETVIGERYEFNENPPLNRYCSLSCRACASGGRLDRRHGQRRCTQSTPGLL